MSKHHEQDHLHDTSTNNQTTNQRSTPSTPEHEINSATQTMKFQPQRQNPKIHNEAHLCILICGGRAGCRLPREITPRVLILVGWVGC